MNCTHCGKKLYPEAPYCPHCGGVNVQRVQLEDNVRAFDASYDATEQEVRAAVKRKNRFIAELTILLFLVLAFVGSLVLHAYLVNNLAYDMRRDRMRRELDTILATENAYLDEQDYFGLNAYFLAGNPTHEINNLAPEMRRVNTAVSYYCESMLSIMAYAEELAAEKPYQDSRVSRARSVRSYMESFYNAVYGEPPTDTQVREDAVDQMRMNLEAALVAVFGMPAEEAASLSGATAGARGVLLETYVQPPEITEEGIKP